VRCSSQFVIDRDRIYDRDFFESGFDSGNIASSWDAPEEWLNDPGHRRRRLHRQ
jgi:hypothetical protein